MDDGIYKIAFATEKDWGIGLLIFYGGKIVGADAGAVLYDGSYKLNQSTGMVNTEIIISIPAGVETVFGIIQKHDWAFSLSPSFPSKTTETPMLIETPLGPVNVTISFLRPLPEFDKEFENNSK